MSRSRRRRDWPPPLADRPIPFEVLQRRLGARRRSWVGRGLPALLMLAALAGAGWMLRELPDRLPLALRHLIAASNCTLARAVDLAPARVGEPGYWRHLDRDHDGIACEPVPAWREVRRGPDSDPLTLTRRRLPALRPAPTE